jgi:hypothetical protein
VFYYIHFFILFSTTIITYFYIHMNVR